jgi:hypothetical protein
MATITTSAPPDAAPTESAGRRRRLEVDRLFTALVKLEGSDLHLKSGKPPYVRVKGSLQPKKRWNS